MSYKILFVDDEENVLSAFRRQLRGRFEVETARSGIEALELLTKDGPFAVVVSDLRMPGMSGIDFLAKARQAAPDTVRIMLTGYADLGNAISAVNEGNIFRFLTKPSPPEHVIKAIEDGIKQHQLINSERDLLEKTLKGSINLLTDVLSTVSPVAFSLTLRLRRVVSHILKNMAFSAAWQVEIAAMLSQIGCVLIPASILEKINQGIELSDEEKKTYSSHPLIGYRLMVGIPRLEQAACMVRDQLKAFSEFEASRGAVPFNDTQVGAHILKAAVDYHQLIATGMPHSEAVNAMRQQPEIYNPRVIKALSNEAIDLEMWDSLLAGASTLVEGMILGEDIFSTASELVAKKYAQLTPYLIERIRECHASQGLVEPFRVFVPAYVDLTNGVATVIPVDIDH
jgi:response regulator RpfG family c-di-GMP phosphodiesterase